MSEPAADLEFDEYSTLIALRAIVKGLNNLVADPKRWRSPVLRRLATSATGVLEECVTEISSYAPGFVAQENTRLEDLPPERGDDHEHSTADDSASTSVAGSAKRGRPVGVKQPMTEKMRAKYDKVHTCGCGRTGKWPGIFKHMKVCSRRYQKCVTVT